MENLKDRIKAFLSVGSGYGSGDGSGSGSGYGYGYGYGSGSGYGSGYGSGDGDGDGDGSGDGSGYGYGDGYGDGYGYGSGDGYGYGSGDGIQEWHGRKVYYIDDVPTLIDSVHDNYAKGSIVQQDFTLQPCFVAKYDGQFFAHGDTLHKAMEDAISKSFEDIPVEERIDKFVGEYATLDTVVKNTDLFVWHNRLTGSCEMGRSQFAKEHDIDVNNGSMTVGKFIALTINSYGGDVIEQLKEKYEYGK